MNYPVLISYLSSMVCALEPGGSLEYATVRIVTNLIFPNQDSPKPQHYTECHWGFREKSLNKFKKILKLREKISNISQNTTESFDRPLSLLEQRPFADKWPLFSFGQFVFQVIFQLYSICIGFVVLENRFTRGDREAPQYQR